MNLACKFTAVFGWSEVRIPLMTHLRRNHNRPNLQRPLPLHYKRARMLGVVKPQYPPEIRLCEKLVTAVTSDKQNIKKNGYALYLARKMRESFYSHPMVAIFHANCYKEFEFLKVRGMLHDAKFDMSIQNKISKEISHEALGGTKFEPVLPLLERKSSVGFCSTEDVSKLLKVLKKAPQFILIGLIKEDRLMHRADIEAYAKLRNLTTQQYNLSNTLTLASTHIPNSLETNQILLTRSLSLHSSIASSS